MIGQAKKLVKKVFPRQGLIEGRYFFGWRYRNHPLMKGLFRLVGIKDLESAWVDVDDDGRVRGLVGLYSRVEDASQARWVSWFCVDPAVRGQGRGKALLDFVMNQAREQGFSFLRLYTSTEKVMEKAQLLYESRGLKIVKRKKRLGYETLVREVGLL